MLSTIVVIHYSLHPNSHQVYSPDENDSSAKLKTTKEELEAGKAVVDAQFGDLIDIDGDICVK